MSFTNQPILPHPVSSTNQQRRTKNFMPANNKDELYWEKRKRNNIAAKKSRENKRRFDTNIRQTLADVEQENALLKKELYILKTRFGIPQNKSFLSEEDKIECLQEVMYTPMTEQDSPRTVSDTGKSFVKEEYFSDDNECSIQMQPSTDKSRVAVWAYAQARMHAQSSQSLERYSPGAFNLDVPKATPVTHVVNQNLNERPTDTYHFTQSVATDLSVNKNKRKRDDTDFNEIQKNKYQNRYVNIENNSISFTEPRFDLENDNDLEVEVINDIHREVRRNQEIGKDDTISPDELDIKTQLQSLSEQVQKMQKLVNVSQ